MPIFHFLEDKESLWKLEKHFFWLKFLREENCILIRHVFGIQFKLWGEMSHIKKVLKHKFLWDSVTDSMKHSLKVSRNFFSDVNFAVAVVTCRVGLWMMSSEVAWFRKIGLDRQFEGKVMILVTRNVNVTYAEFFINLLTNFCLN